MDLDLQCDRTMTPPRRIQGVGEMQWLSKWRDQSGPDRFKKLGRFKNDRIVFPYKLWQSFGRNLCTVAFARRGKDWHYGQRDTAPYWHNEPRNTTLSWRDERAVWAARSQIPVLLGRKENKRRKNGEGRLK
ncbi:hypothetical protein HAX54_035538 [Datura stramonium]|uniref:Uncharacterized protein n=1 Tax=Datura stramonium TaxID=4076 RepID=A0ABS8VIE4_DATST|nr:hypothetical protein [Datura stramonium]